MYYGMFWDSTYILVIIGAIICLIAQAKVKNTFNKYSKYRSSTGITGAQAAQRILYANGINDVRIQPVSGSLTDNYNPMNKTLNLSESVYNSSSVAAIGVAAHECGHAIQHQKHYVPLSLRAAFVPVANIGSYAAWPLIIIGCLLNVKTTSGNIGFTLIMAGIIAFSFAVIFQIITLPVEFNASRRAVNQLDCLGILGHDELKATEKVLKAAALTYVASCAAAILQLLRLILIFGRRD